MRRPSERKKEQSDELPSEISESDLQSLARFRRSLRGFLAFSEKACAQMDITMQWYQALLTIKTFKKENAISIGELAAELMIKNHSATELVVRLENAGLVTKKSDKVDKRRSVVIITPNGNRKLSKLAAIHLNWLRTERHVFLNLFTRTDSIENEPFESNVPCTASTSEDN